MQTKFVSVLQFFLHAGCATTTCNSWEIDAPYAGTSIHGMVICKDLIANYDQNNDGLIYDEAERLLLGSNGPYEKCRAIRDSLIISTKNNQLFIKIDCAR